MRALTKTENNTESRLLSLREAAAYIGQGTTKTREWLDSIGAKKSSAAGHYMTVILLIRRLITMTRVKT